MIHKKAEGLSLQTIVIAAICLFVLIVMIIIFGGKAKFGSDFYKDCGKVEGVPISVSAGTEPSCDNNAKKTIIHPLYTKKNDKGEVIEICCVESLI